MISTSSTSTPGDILRHWRKVRRLSQMELAATASVSTRHLSFVETGRARPSETLILRLSEALQLPLRHINTLLVAAGYAPHYRESSLDDDNSGIIQDALDHMLKQHLPYPAIVINRDYHILMHNAGFAGLARWLGKEALLLCYPANIFRAIFAADGLWRFFADWPLVGQALLLRLTEEQMLYQSEALATLYAECQASDAYGAASEGNITETTSAQLPVLRFVMQKGGVALSFFSTITSFGTAIDVTVQELRVESMFPANPETKRFFHRDPVNK